MKVYGKKDGLTVNFKEKIEKAIMTISEVHSNLPIYVYYGYPFFEMDNTKVIMKVCIICSKGFITLFGEEKEKIVYSRHLTDVMTRSSILYQIFEEVGTKGIIHSIQIDDLGALKNTLLDAEDHFKDSDIRIANIVIQKVYGINRADDRVINSKGSLGELIKKRNNEMSALDETQFEMIYDEVKHHTRIRGLAGSGKTILLVKKMAYLHYQYPDYEMAYVFYTKSLKQYILDLFEKHYHDYAPNRKPNLDKIHILHSWGGTEMEGFYSRACVENEVPRQTYNDVAGNNKFDKVCLNLLNTLTGKSKPLYDFVFVDEAQDFSINFFKLVLATLKYNGKMIYAYDELQSLNDYQDIMPSKQEIFKDEPCEDVDLKICYRTPKKILVAAHALGLGIYRKNKEGKSAIINMMRDTNIWTAIGYSVEEGELAYGKQVRLNREEVIDIQPGECVSIKPVKQLEDQYHLVAEEILNLITNQDVLPEDIMIIDLSAIKLQDNYQEFKKVFRDEKEVVLDELPMERREENTYKLIQKTGIHIVNKDNAIRFKKESSIPYTSIFRAKGNEANIVYIINAQTMSSMESYTRNRLFTAMTRARFKVSIIGVESPALATLNTECKEIVDHNFTLEFRYPNYEELEDMRTIAKEDAKNAETFGDAYNRLKGRTDMTVEILKEQLGVSSIDELISKLQEWKDES